MELWTRCPKSKQWNYSMAGEPPWECACHGVQRETLVRVPLDEVHTIWLAPGGGCDFIEMPGWEKCYYIRAAALGEEP